MKKKIYLVIMLIIIIVVSLFVNYNKAATFQASQVPYNFKFTDVSIVDSITFLLDSEGYLYSCGRDLTSVPKQMSTSTKFSKISAPYAIDTSGNIWGLDGTSIKQLTVGVTYTSISSCAGVLAIDSSNNMWGKGANSFGELGNGETTELTSFTKIKSGMKNVEKGTYHSLGIDTSGNLWAWGNNSYGEIGNGTQNNQYTPVKIKSGISQISVGDNCSYALDTSGNLWAWGNNRVGQLGNGGVGNSVCTGNSSCVCQTIPVKIMSEVKTIEAGSYHTTAIDMSDNLYTWGDNSCGELGNGTTINTNVPSKATTSGTVNKVSAGRAYTAIIDAKGDLWMCGNDFYGEFGDGRTGSANITNQNFVQITKTPTYTITYNLNGGKINSGNVTTYDLGEETILPTDVTKTGYTFGGWYTSSSCTGTAITKIGSTETGNKTYYAKWTANTYNVTLNVNGGTISSGKNITSYTYGTNVTLPTSTYVTKTGCTFGGWYDNSGCTGTAITKIGSTETGNKTYYAKWTANTYSVTLNADGGTIASGKNITSYTYGIEVTLPTSAFMTKTGYTFGGWYTNSACTGIAVTKISSTETGNKTYYAKWTVNTARYSIQHYKQNTLLNGYVLDNTETKSGNVGAMATAIAKTYEGFTENTTYMDRKITGTIEADGSLVLKLYYDRNEYNVTLNTNEGTINTGNITKYVYGVEQILPTNVTKTGYTFGGWYDNSGCTGTAITKISSTETGKKTYYAKWTINQYTVTFKDGDKLEKTETVNYGSNATAPGLTKEGYTLSWDKDYSNVTENMTVNAVWTANTNTVYKVEHYKQNSALDGYVLEETENLTGTTEETVTAIAKAYEGFIENTTYVDRIVTGKVEADGSLVLKLYYDRNEYNVTLNTNGGTINTGNITKYVYGVEQLLPTNVTKTGYTFGGWYDNSGCIGTAITKISSTETGNKTYYAKWTINQYTVTFKDGDKVEKTETVNYGSNATAPGLTKEGYTLSWDKDFSNVTEDMTVNTIWTINQYTVTFKDGDKVEKTETVNYGSNATAPELTKEGYTLSWDKDFSNVTENMTVNAIWTQKESNYIISNVYNIDDIYIDRISPETTLNIFKTKVDTNGTIKVYKKDNTVLGENELISTGDKIEVTYPDGTKQEYKAVVIGDINGDGKITITDVSLLNQTVVGKKTLENEYKRAADIDNNTKISITDISLINQAIVGKIKL